VRITPLLGHALVASALAASACGPSYPIERSGTVSTWAGVGGLDGRNGDGLDRRDTRLHWPIDVTFAPDGTPWIIDWNNHVVRRVNADATVETVVGTDMPGDGPLPPKPPAPEFAAPGVPCAEIGLNHPTQVLFPADGSMLLVSWHNHKLRKIDLAAKTSQIIAGAGPGNKSEVAAKDARFNQPRTAVLGPDGTIYILDQRNLRIRAIAPDGTLTNLAGTTEGYGGDDGPAAAAQFNFEIGDNPEPSGGLAVLNGALYVADDENFRIRKIDLTTKVITTVVGTGVDGSTGDGGAGKSAQIGRMRDLELGPDGKLYFVESEHHKVRSWDPVADVVSTVVGNGERGRCTLSQGVPSCPCTDGTAPLQCALNRPVGVSFDKDGVMYVSDTFNSRILRVNP